MQYKTAVLPAKKSFSKTYLLAAAALVVMAFAFCMPHAHADVTPTLSLSPGTDGDTVTAYVSGDPSESVELFYTKTGVSGSQVSYLGTTNSSGLLTTTLSSSYYGIVSGTAVHVTVNGINGLSSSIVAWPTVNSTNTSGIVLSQTGVVVPVGQSTTITTTNNTGGTLYVSNNSNPSVANPSISGSSIVVTGNTYGSTTLTICSTTSSTNCPSVYVTVENSGASTLSFSQNTITVGQGQSVPVTISGGNGVYTVLNNSNASVITPVISGNTITLSTSYSSGSSSVTVCSTDMTACGIINATAGTTSTVALTFTQSSPNVMINQVTSIGIYGGSGSYYVSTNTNPGVVSYVLSGSNISLTGLQSGTSSITVCSSTGGCSVLTPTVSYTATGGALALSQTSLSLAAGQTLSLSISGGTSPYSLATPSTSVYTASISGNILTVEGLSAGSQQIAVCSASGGCTWLSLQVNGSTVITSGAPILSQTSISLPIGQGTNIAISSGNGSYYVSSNSSPSIATASINGSSVYVTAVNPGTDSISVCQSGGACAYLSVSVTSTSVSTVTGQAALLSFGTPIETLGLGQSASLPVTGGSGSYYVAYNSNSSAVSAVLSGNELSLTGEQLNSLDIIVVCSSTNSCGSLPVVVGTVASTSTSVATGSTSTSTSSSNAGDGYQFTSFLTVGTQSNEVAELQLRLGVLGYFSGSDTGYFGSLTRQAVIDFQAANGLPQVGYVGPSTRAVLNR